MNVKKGVDGKNCKCAKKSQGRRRHKTSLIHRVKNIPDGHGRSFRAHAHVCIEAGTPFFFFCCKTRTNNLIFMQIAQWSPICAPRSCSRPADSIKANELEKTSLLSYTNSIWFTQCGCTWRHSFNFICSSVSACPPAIWAIMKFPTFQVSSVNIC